MRNDFSIITVYRHSLIISLDRLFILILVSSLLCGFASNFFHRLYETTTLKTFLSQNKTRPIQLEICLLKTLNKHHFVIRCICFTRILLREKCPNAEFFLVPICLYSVQIQENTDQKKLIIWTFFAQCVRER